MNPLDSSRGSVVGEGHRTAVRIGRGRDTPNGTSGRDRRVIRLLLALPY
jgi:hypothetical protein